MSTSSSDCQIRLPIGRDTSEFSERIPIPVDRVEVDPAEAATSEPLLLQ